MGALAAWREKHPNEGLQLHGVAFKRIDWAGADLRFADCGWRKAFLGLAAFNETMMTRESIKVSAPPAGLA